jgi:hypothetical protein
MSQQNFAKLASQGRAYDATREWSEEELQALLTLEAKCSLARTVAAEYVRNGIRTAAEYEKAQEANFAPKSFEAVRSEAVAAHVVAVRKDLGIEDEPLLDEEAGVETGETEAEEVGEPEVVAEPDAVETVEEVGEPEAKPKTKRKRGVDTV